MAAQHSRDAFQPVVTTAGWGGRMTRAEVNLDAVAANVRALKKVAAGASLMAVVKGDGYGHGASMVARTALEAGAERLGVYTVEEGVLLRRQGITAPILVFGPFTRAEAGQIWSENLTPTVTSIGAIESLGATARAGTLPVHLKVDTGLTRAGAAPRDVPALLSALRRFPFLALEGIYTHLARADEADRRTTSDQIALFRSTLAALGRDGIDVPVCHAANSAGTLYAPEARYDMVRIGISLYGYNPSCQLASPVPLRPALSLLSSVIRLERVPIDTGVGYGHEFRAIRPTTIALVPAGYGDGLPRSLGCGRGRVLVRGTAAPIVGRVSMDQITLDVTDVPGVRVGDEAVIIGPQVDAIQTADDVAVQAGTISYDILTGLLPRVPRVYVRGGDIVGTLSAARGLQIQVPGAAGAGI